MSARNRREVMKMKGHKSKMCKDTYNPGHKYRHTQQSGPKFPFKKTYGARK